MTKCTPVLIVSVMDVIVSMTCNDHLSQRTPMRAELRDVASGDGWVQQIISH